MRQTKALLSLILLCLIMRVFFSFMVKPWDPVVAGQVILTNDALDYHQLAQSIVEDRSFTIHKGESPDTLRTPLYPLLIALIYAIWGSGSLWIVILVQILLDTFSCILVYWMILKYFDLRTAFGASLCYALDPFLILYSITLLSDILFVFLCLLAAYWFSEMIYRQYEKPTGYILLSAFFFGLATLVRPVSQYLPVVIFLFLLVALRKRLIMACKLGALFLFCFIITLSPWLIRNLYTFGSLSLSTVGQYNLIALYVLPMEMERRNQSFKEVQKAIMEEVDQEIRQEGQKPEELNDFQKSRYWVKFGLHYIGKYPLPFAKHYLLGIFHSFANLGTGPFGDLLQLSKKEGKFEIKAQSNIPHLLNDWWQQKTSQEIQLGVLIGFYLLITYFFLGVGLIAYWRKKRDHPFLVFSLMLVLYFILITGTAGLARFKLPAIPFYLVFVGMGLSHVIRKKGHTNRKESA